jgi:hypothetical protein
MKVGLVGVATLCYYQGGAMADGETVGRMVEADELGGTLGGEDALDEYARVQARMWDGIGAESTEDWTATLAGEGSSPCLLLQARRPQR